MTGGDGNDVFIVQADRWFIASGAEPAVITDFTLEDDTLDISDLVGEYSDLIDYTGGNPFDPTLGYLELVQDGDDTLLNIDYDGVSGVSGTEHAMQPFIQLVGVNANDLCSQITSRLVWIYT
jgi:hypothetical protein